MVARATPRRPRPIRYLVQVRPRCPQGTPLEPDRWERLASDCEPRGAATAAWCRFVGRCGICLSDYEVWVAEDADWNLHPDGSPLTAELFVLTATPNTTARPQGA